MKKKIFSVLLALAMAAVMLPTVAFAADGEVYVGSTQIDNGNNVTYWVNDGAGGITATGASSSNYNVSYDGANKVLTLNGLTLTCNTAEDYYYNNFSYYAIRLMGDFTIHLSGTNSITYQEISGLDGTNYFCGIDYRGSSKALTFTGDGTLAVTGGYTGCKANINPAIFGGGGVTFGKADDASAFTGKVTVSIQGTSSKAVIDTDAFAVKDIIIYSGTVIAENEAKGYAMLPRTLIIKGGTLVASAVETSQAINSSIDLSGYTSPSPTVVAGDSKAEATTLTDSSTAEGYKYVKIYPTGEEDPDPAPTLPPDPNPGDPDPVDPDPVDPDPVDPTPPITPATPTDPPTSSGSNGSSNTHFSIPEGLNQTIKAGDALTVRIDAPLESCTGVTVDGKQLTDKQYSMWSGSTYVKLAPSYTSSLAAGTHTMKVLFTDGVAELTFTVSGTATQTNPNTGANDVVGVAAALALVAALAGAIQLRKK